MSEHLIVFLQKEKAMIIEAKNNQLKAKDREIAAITAAKDEELKAKDREIAGITAARDEQLKDKGREMAAKDDLISATESEISEKDRGLVSLQQRCGSLQTQLETVQRRNQSLEVSSFSF